MTENEYKARLLKATESIAISLKEIVKIINKGEENESKE